MLKRVLLVWYCCAALLILHGQGIKKTITLTFNENDFVYQQSTEGRLTLYSKSGKSFYSDDSNSPAIPYFTYNVLIGPQQTCSGINATEGLRVVQSNVEMSKSPRCKTRENPGMDSPDDNIIMQPIAGESAIVDMKNINLAGFNVVRITISPYRYDPSSRILFLRDTVSICLTLDSSNLQRNRTNFEETNILRKIVVNPDELEELYNVHSVRNNVRSDEIGSVDSIKYLIITNPRLVSAFSPLAKWKTQKGIPTEIRGIYDIYANYEGATNELKIKRCIKDYYDRYDLKYVLIGGDIGVVPSQDCRFNDLVQYYFPSDYFYACLDENNFDWGASNGGCVDVVRGMGTYADICVTRVPIQNDEQATAFVNKILMYEKTPPMEAEYNKILMSGMMTYEMVGNKSDSQFQGEQIYDSLIAPFWSGERKCLYDTYSNIPSLPTPFFSPQNLTNEFKRGYPFVDLICHGDTTVWRMENNSVFSSGIADTLEFTQPTIITTGACLTNAFHSGQDPCLSEAFIRNPNNGVIGYLGSTIEGWCPSSYNEIGPSDRYTGNYYAELFANQGSTHFGDVVRRAKNHVINSHDERYTRTLFASLNPIGDPETPIYTSTPNSFTNTYMEISGNTLNMRVSAPSATVCVMSLRDHGESFYHVGKTGNTGEWYSCQIPESSSIIITKEGYIPEIHYYSKGDTVFIQNVVFEGNSLTQGNVVKIGRSVTSPPYGEVIVEKDVNMVKAAQEVTIEGGFEIKEGAEFSVEIEN